MIKKTNMTISSELEQWYTRKRSHQRWNLTTRDNSSYPSRVTLNHLKNDLVVQNRPEIFLLTTKQNADICNIFQFIVWTEIHTSIYQISLFMITVWQSSKIWKKEASDRHSADNNTALLLHRGSWKYTQMHTVNSTCVTTPWAIKNVPLDIRSQLW